MTAREAILPLRPKGFREPKDMKAAWLTATGPKFATKRTRLTGARALGVKYEKKVHEELIRQYPGFYVSNPWFKFIDGYGMRWCQPDGLLIDAAQGLIVIVEVKYQHTGEAWWKLNKLYLQVVRQFFGELWEYRCIEIVRWYDPSVIFPLSKLTEKVHLTPPCPQVGVHIWKP